ncbi:MAG: acetolactate synthase small subunit [Oscillospiraceae bacterium]|jgi:acetolactate synthase-1/3 small subunit
MKGNTSSVFTLLVDNEFGVLTRITALIRRAGWNIRSLAVAETKTPEISRLTICLECRHNTLEQVLDRLKRLDCVREILPYSKETQVARELALLHLLVEDEASLQQVCQQMNATIVERKDGHVLLSAVCEEGYLDQMLPTLREQGLLDIARTGAISLRRNFDGKEDTTQ